MKAKISATAFDYFKSGFNCAESVSRAIIENYTHEINPDFLKIATAFGGGIGGSHKELCGALAGGIIAIGYLLGRTDPDTDNTLVKELASEFRNEFIQSFGKTRCQSLLDDFGFQENDEKCQELTGKTTGILVDLLSDYGIQPQTK